MFLLCTARYYISFYKKPIAYFELAFTTLKVSSRRVLLLQKTFAAFSHSSFFIIVGGEKEAPEWHVFPTYKKSPFCC